MPFLSCSFFSFLTDTVCVPSQDSHSLLVVSDFGTVECVLRYNKLTY